MILLSPDIGALTAGAVGAFLGALVFLAMPPAGAAMAAFAAVAARRRGRPAFTPRLGPPRSPMMVSRDWSSLADIVVCVSYGCVGRWVSVCGGWYARVAVG